LRAVHSVQFRQRGYLLDGISISEKISLAVMCGQRCFAEHIE
jgi:hypothetical protein